MRFYESVFIARQDATPAQVETLAGQYTQIVRGFGGEVTKTEFCGLRSLAYPINKNKKGHYVLMNLQTKPEAVKEIERLMSINSDILRYLTVRVEELDNNPSPLMQQRNFRPMHFDGDQQSDLPNFEGE